MAYDSCDMDNVLVDIEAMLSCEDMSAADWVINVDDVLHAISCMKPNKYDSMNELLLDYVLNAGNVLAACISFVFLSMIIHGSVPDIFLTSTILPIPKNKNCNVTDSANYRGIALSSVFRKIFDHIMSLFVRNIGMGCALQNYSLDLNVRVSLTLILYF